jgi:hypothetical protein
VASDRITVGPYVVGEIPAPLEYTFQESDGSAMDLTGYTAKFLVRPSDGGPAVELDATVSTPLAGQVTYTWDGTELEQPGPHWAQIWVGDGTNRFASLRLEFSVRASVGPVPAV